MVGSDQCRHEGGKCVVVAKPQLAHCNRVVLVDNRDDTEQKQLDGGVV